MRLGFLTDYAEERLRFAQAAGFTCLELRAVPGSALDPTTLDADAIARVKEAFAAHGLAVAALACYGPNPLEEGQETERAAYFRQVLALAPRLGCPVVAAMTGATAETIATGDLAASLPAFRRVWSEHAAAAEANGVKIAFEPWPGAHPYPLRGNIAVSPAAWDMLFDAVPSPALGLEYDPSHLVRLQIDYLAPIRRFADRIHHVHAKDTIFNEDVRREAGTIGPGWWRYALPPRGVVDWAAFFAALRAIGYTGDVNIEHEDSDFGFPAVRAGGKFDEGLRLAQRFLAQFMDK